MDIGIMIPILVSIVVGVAVAFQGSVNTMLYKTIGLWEANFIVHLTGAIILAVILLLGLGQGSLTKIAEAPKVSLLGGLMGVLIVSGSIFTITKLGVSTALALFVCAQLIAACLIDNFGWFGLETIPFSLSRGIAVIFLVIGVFLMNK